MAGKDGFKEIPKPSYERDTARLVRYFMQALDAIRVELAQYDVTDTRRAHALGVIASIVEILKQLNKDVSALIEKLVPAAVSDGIARALVALGVAETLAEAQGLVKFNRLNKELVAAVVADVQSDVLAVTQNIERRVKATIRQVTAEVLRSNVTQGVNGSETLSRDLRKKLYETLGDSADTAIISSDGKRWKLKHYTDMLIRTKMMEAHKEATINEAVSRGALYGVISRHNATDACRKWEGKVVKLTPDAPGNYPYIGDLPRREIFHPRCRHTITPVRRPDRLPTDLREINDI